MFNNHEYRLSSVACLSFVAQRAKKEAKAEVSSIENRLSAEVSTKAKVSSIEHRESVLIPLHLSRELYKSNLFLQNKPKFKNAQIYTSACIIRGYDIFLAFARPKNKAKQTQFKANSNPICKWSKMNVTFVLTKNYENFSLFGLNKTKPIQTQIKPKTKTKAINYELNYEK